MENERYCLSCQHVYFGDHVCPGPPKRCDQPASHMTIRERFAMAAMQGLIAASGDSEGGVDYDDATVAANSVAMADALLAELGKPKP